jgi:hypothetical protein
MLLNRQFTTIYRGYTPLDGTLNQWVPSSSLGSVTKYCGIHKKAPRYDEKKASPIQRGLFFAASLQLPDSSVLLNISTTTNKISHLRLDQFPEFHANFDWFQKFFLFFLLLPPASKAVHALPFEVMLLAMLLEEHKEVMKLRERVEAFSTRLV